MGKSLANPDILLSAPSAIRRCAAMRQPSEADPTFGGRSQYRRT